MTKIAKDFVCIKNVTTDIEIHYNRKNLFFIRGIPEEIYEMTKLKHGHYPTEYELKKALRDALVEYHEKIKTQRKVILYSLKGSSALIMDDHCDGCYSGRKSNVSPKFETMSGPKYMFGFSFDILLEVKTNRSEYFRIKNDGTTGYRMDIHPGQQLILIDWTPQREQFFHNMAEQLQNLIYGVSAFFDKPEMLELIDSGQGRMLGE